MYDLASMSVVCRFLVSASCTSCYMYDFIVVRLNVFSRSWRPYMGGCHYAVDVATFAANNQPYGQYENWKSTNTHTYETLK